MDTTTDQSPQQPDAAALADKSNLKRTSDQIDGELSDESESKKVKEGDCPSVIDGLLATRSESSAPFAPLDENATRKLEFFFFFFLFFKV